VQGIATCDGLLRRGVRATGSRAVLAAFLILAALAAPVGVARAAPVPGRALLPSERFTPEAGAADQPLAHELVAQPGERESFQAIVQVPAGTSRLVARVAPAVAADPVLATAELALVAFVDVTRPSTAISRGAGLYADPLPPLPPRGLPARDGRWNGVLVTFRVPRGTPAGSHAGRVVFSDAGGDYAEVPFTLRVAAVEALPWRDAAAFRITVPVQIGPYVEAAPVTTDDQRIARMVSLVRFMAERHVTPWDYPFVAPTPAGAYPTVEQTGIWTRAPGSFLGAYLADPSAADTAARVLPHRSLQAPVSMMDAEPRAAFLAGVAAGWLERGWPVAGSLFHVWDEPSPASEQNQMPAINAAVHAALPGVLTYAESFPVVPRPARRLCKWFGDRACRTFRGSEASNEHLWDGGADDVDIWSIATRRYYGRYTTPLERHYDIDNGHERYRLLQELRRRGKQIWSYAYFNRDRRLPDLAIDGPATDPSLLMAFSAYEANGGWFHWAFNRWLDSTPGSGAARNPYDDPLSWIVGQARSNGEATLIYPPFASAGAADGTAEPVSSLRLEQIADGAELANLAAQARALRGDAWVRAAFRPVFSGRLRVTDTGASWLRYRNGGLARRLELVRRALLAGVETSP